MSFYIWDILGPLSVSITLFTLGFKMHLRQLNHKWAALKTRVNDHQDALWSPDAFGHIAYLLECKQKCVLYASPTGHSRKLQHQDIGSNEIWTQVASWTHLRGIMDTSVNGKESCCHSRCMFKLEEVAVISPRNILCFTAELIFFNLIKFTWMLAF